MHFHKVSEDEIGYLGSLNDLKRFLTAISLLSDLPDKSEWTFIRDERQSQIVGDQPLEIGRYFSTD